jgi:hypothetical protein
MGCVLEGTAIKMTSQPKICHPPMKFKPERFSVQNLPTLGRELNGSHPFFKGINLKRFELIDKPSISQEDFKPSGLADHTSITCYRPRGYNFCDLLSWLFSGHLNG